MASRLSERLRAIGLGVPPGGRPVDVGTHHGLLPLHLLAEGRVARCIATETARGRYQGAAEHPGLILRFGDGLHALRPDDEVDTVIVSGLGARTLLRILDHPRVDRQPRLVLQPQTEWASVRRRLLEIDFALIDERIVEDAGHDYLVLVAEHSPRCRGQYRTGGLSLADLLEAGPLLTKNPDASFVRHWHRREQRALAILGRARGGSGRLRAELELARARRILAVAAS